MAIELKIPSVGESVQEVQIARWLKREGDSVTVDENVVELETDKASMELAAPATGVVKEILKKDGEKVAVGETIARFEERSPKAAPEQKADTPQPTAAPPVHVTPAGRRALSEHGLKAEAVQPGGGRIGREEVLDFLSRQQHPPTADEPKNAEGDGAPTPPVKPGTGGEHSLEQVVPMSLIRRRIAERLVEARQNAALVTTFNEIDMSAVIGLRKSLGERFQKRYGVKLGFMSFFVKAAIDALKEFPEINAEVRGTDVIYRNYFHIGVAVDSERGLVVPVLRFAERMSFAEIERAIDDLAGRARQNKLKPDELAGGTFTITNGGVYGSLFSTPIVNPPQSGVLGMHAIEERPVGREGQILLRPMMYVALTYDHRIVDGRPAVSFLRRMKETIEEPARMLVEV